MRRREFVGLVGGMAAWPFAAIAQQPKMLRVGLVTTTIPRRAPQYVTLVNRLAELGYIEGQNFIFDFVSVEGHLENFGPTMKELVSRKADVLVAFGNEYALKAAMAASSTVPIVMIAIDFDPLALGYIKSLARPGGNVTGLFLQQVELAEKRVELAKQAFPELTAATMLWDAPSASQWQATRRIAPTLGLDIVGVEMRDRPYDYERALSETPADHRKFVIVGNSAGFFFDRSRLGEFMIARGVPSICPAREFADAGALISYGADFLSAIRRMAEFIDKIARGAGASDLPVEQPTKFELVVNLKTARSLGLTMPPSLFARADEVIE